MNVIIVEDEFAAGENIKNILKCLEPDINIIDVFDTVSSTVAWLRANPAPDLIFMDIQLADTLSFAIFECVTVEAPIIFTTAYDEYAIRAFEVNSIDYLLKPISIEAVGRALDKFKKLTQPGIQRAIRNLESFLRPKDYLKRVLILVHDKIIPVKTEEIAYFYKTNGVNELVTKDNKHYPMDKPLDTLMESLDPTSFFRANRQFIVSKDSIENITIWFDSRLLINMLLEVPERIYVSKNNALAFKTWFAIS